MSLLQMSVSAGVMIFIVTVIRALAINRLPKKTFLALWGIVLARLLAPFSWPSPLSVYSLVNRQGGGQISGALTGTIFPMAAVEHTFTIPAAAPAAGFSLWALIWGIGAVLCTLYFAVSYIRCHREFRVSYPAENSFITGWLSEHKCRRPITIRQTSGISAPLTYGIFRPVILMPAGTAWTGTKELQYVLAHEYVHIRRFDSATKLLLTAALCIHWFNPLVWAMYVLANRDLELSCDEKVVRTFGVTIKSAYALTLIGMEEAKSGLIPLCNNFSKNAIEERIRAIMKIKKTSIAALTLAVCLVGGVTTVFATSASANANDDSVMTGIGLARKADANSPYQYSDDNGATWISEDEYNTMNPRDDVVWWTYDEYKAWVDEQKVKLPRLIGTDAKYLKDGKWVGFTRQSVDESIRLYENDLEEIKNGAKLSKTVNGDESIAMMSYSPQDGDVGASYGASTVDQNGVVTDLGEFTTKEARLSAVKQYCSEQVKAGKMSQAEADQFIKKNE